MIHKINCRENVHYDMLQIIVAWPVLQSAKICTVMHRDKITKFYSCKVRLVQHLVLIINFFLFE